MKIVIADTDEAALARLGKELVAAIGETSVLIVPTDVSKLEQVQALSKRVYDAWGEVRICATSEVHRRASCSVLSLPTSSSCTIHMQMRILSRDYFPSIPSSRQ
jgi:hypothetical protein